MEEATTLICDRGQNAGGGNTLYRFAAGVIVFALTGFAASSVPAQPAITPDQAAKLWLSRDGQYVVLQFSSRFAKNSTRLRLYD